MTSHTYNGTASVGDFMTLTVDPETLTISYDDRSNGQAGSIPFTWNIDGSYTLNDPSGNLTFAYEIPGYGIVVKANKTGPARNSMAMIAAMETTPVSLAGLAGTTYNCMTVGTSAGGLQVGSETVTTTAASTATYWPYGALAGTAQQAASLPLTGAVLDISGSFLTAPLGSGGNAYAFGSAGNVFAIDTTTGSLIATPQAATSAFNAAWAGTYKAVSYQKVEAAMSESGVESGIVSVNDLTLVVNAAGLASLYDDLGDQVASGTLTAVADASYLFGGAGAPLSTPCNGLFTFRGTAGGVQQDFFCSFATGAAVFSVFSAPAPWVPGSSTYSYLYGVGLLAP